MKKHLFIFFCVLTAAIGVRAQNNATLINSEAPAFQFTGGDTHDFGNVEDGPDAVYIFAFTNTGKEPLRLHDVSASCSCTVPDWSRTPVMPGEKGSIKVHYKTEGRLGEFERQVYIMSNAPVPTGGERYLLTIKGTVVKPAPKKKVSPKK